MVAQRIEVAIYIPILQAFEVNVYVLIGSNYLLNFLMAVEALDEEISGLFVRGVLIEAFDS